MTALPDTFASLPLARCAGRPATGAYPDRLKPVLSLAAHAEAMTEIADWPGYAPTPLVALSGLARAAGLGAIHYKHEAGRFGLGSFKALGGAYAVLRLLKKEILRRTGQQATSRDLLAGRFRDVAADITVTCATDGNHGRSVAWGAQVFGCRCVIYIHATVSEGRRAAIARYGAEVVRTAGNYDDAVRAADAAAKEHGRFVVSDTSYPGYTDVPRDVMQGYSVMVEEALRQWPEAAPPTHVFVQGGVGGLAAAVCAQMWERLGDGRGRFVVVEPDKAACLYESARAGRPVAVHGDLDTLMAGLACGEVSLIAWDVLEAGAADFLTVPDEAAVACMRLLADAPCGDTPIAAGESAVAGLAGLLMAASRPDVAAALGLGPDCRVLLFGSEGATDPALYEQLVGRAAEGVER
ncbi:diaminopropionate ammonia-lyase [Pseudothauera rhizosphaerae]|uniref:Diaminopropionate ammonia-lyase n=1 Tax=Pseudothauera rhizosphaerae TaxID=2565932 RepID=A0A4S4ASU7_9RHOO|nr:diaminopropionate ammonia-lyase [Pseudothauera rhizosphaerae]THF62238.1 diaminopropionate ammonia-lyase [Pseudothauera rhizosphaerae]